MAQTTTRDWMKPEDLADEWQLSTSTLANWRSAKIGPPYVKLNGLVRYSHKAVTAWVAAQQPDLGGAA